MEGHPVQGDDGGIIGGMEDEDEEKQKRRALPESLYRILERSQQAPEAELPHTSMMPPSSGPGNTLPIIKSFPFWMQGASWGVRQVKDLQSIFLATRYTLVRYSLGL